jgi:nucleotide-binding universal stress UspA family protein
MIILKNLLVATDFSEPSELALTYGRDLARRFGAKLHVLHVLDDVPSRAVRAGGYAVDFSDIERAAAKAAREQLDGIVTDDDRRELSAEAVLRTSTSPAQAIVWYAKEAEIDVIVMGTHGRGKVAQLLMGSVAERVVRTAKCPVLTVGMQPRSHEDTKNT